jgi:hypothetical protein
MAISLLPETFTLRDILSATVNASTWASVLGVGDKRVSLLSGWSSRFFDALALENTNVVFKSFFEAKETWGARLASSASLAGNVCDILDLADAQIGIINLGQRLTLIRVASLVSGLVGDVLSLAKEYSFASGNEDSMLVIQSAEDGTREIVIGGSSVVTARGRFWAAAAKIICSIAWTILAIAALLTGVSIPHLSLAASTMIQFTKVYLYYLEKQIKSQ